MRRARAEARWEQTMELTRTYITTRAAVAKLGWSIVQTSLCWLNTEYQTNGERQQRGVRSKRECTHAHTHTHDWHRRSCGVKANLRNELASERQRRRRRPPSGRAYSERRRKRSMRTTKDLSHTPTRTHDRQLRSCSVTYWWWLITEYQTYSECQRERGTRTTMELTRARALVSSRAA